MPRDSDRGEELGHPPQQRMTGRQIRWQSVGRAAAIVAAGIAGIASLPALLGSDKPRPVPPDVGLMSPPASAALPPSPQSPAATPQSQASRRQSRASTGRRPHSRLAERRRRRRPDRHGAREERKPGHWHRGEGSDRGDVTPPPPPAPVAPAYSPPTYSYLPPPNPGEFTFER